VARLFASGAHFSFLVRSNQSYRGYRIDSVTEYLEWWLPYQYFESWLPIITIKLDVPSRDLVFPKNNAPHMKLRISLLESLFRKRLIPKLFYNFKQRARQGRLL